MRKLTTIFILLPLLPAFSGASPTITNEAQENQTTVSEFIIGKLQGVGRDSLFLKNDHIFARSQQDGLCWSAKISGLANRSISVIELFNGPKNSKFLTDTPKSQLTSTHEGRDWKHAFQTNADPQGYIENCWFIATDDIPGNYTISVSIEGQPQSIFQYRIVKDK